MHCALIQQNNTRPLSPEIQTESHRNTFISPTVLANSLLRHLSAANLLNSYRSLGLDKHHVELHAEAQLTQVNIFMYLLDGLDSLIASRHVSCLSIRL
jgi:hypothetical protein